MRTGFLVLSVVAATALTGCGGGGTKTVTVERGAASGATTASSVPTAADECAAKGITTAERRSGRCRDGNVVRIVAPFGKPVRLRKYDVTVQKRYTVKAVDGGDAAPSVRAKGRFVIFKMKVRNRSNRPTGWSSGVGATALKIGDVVYSADASTAAFSKGYELDGDPGLEGSVEVQPGRSMAAWVAFDVPVSKLPLLKKPGAELLLVDFNESANGFNAASETADEQGVVPLWK